MRIEFIIDELLLVGFDPRDRHRLADAIEGQLAALVTPADVMPLARSGIEVPVLRGADNSVPAMSAAAASSEAIAKRVSGSIVSAFTGRARR